MKTIEQLLDLAKNRYYTFTADEQERLDNFLEKRRAKKKKSSRKKSSSKSSEDTPVHVKNVVDKANTDVPTVKNAVS